MKWMIALIVYFAWGAMVTSYAIADDDYDNSEQAKVAKHANQFIARAYGRE